MLDSMCGSGTTCKVAYQLDRSFIGIDMSSEYCELARNRIKQYQMQPTFKFEEERAHYSQQNAKQQ